MNKSELDYISKKKISYPIKEQLREYLDNYDRLADIPILYKDLMHYANSYPLINLNGEDTLWESVIYNKTSLDDINASLKKIYALLKTAGDLSDFGHLSVDRIDYCTFGNSNPFRIRIINHVNDNYDYFYVKKADASRVYGLELEHILSPNRINYVVKGDTLIEEHIAGIPGDQFIQDYLYRSTTNTVRIAKEFVKFNERCFIRLLGDMRSYNYVIDITPDFDNEQYRVRAIDFDQQNFEGKRTLYMPQFFKENNAIVQFCIELMTEQTVKQYQREERTLMSKRLHLSKHKLGELLNCMKQDTISLPEKVAQLKEELNEFHNTKVFGNCINMGEILETNLKVLLE